LLANDTRSGNVGLSLGGLSGFVSMVGHYGIFAKLVICAMMIRGRHRGLPYALDRAINLPDVLAAVDANDDDEARAAEKRIDPTD
jgi:Trk/Ktr/HKT type cation transporter